jgi:hypothetical protein
VIQELTRDWPASLQLVLSGYITNHAMDARRLMRVDLVLILLRLADDAEDDFVRREALERVAELTGRAITHCPSAMPPWPPLPVARRAAVPKVVRVTRPNPCSENTDMARRYDQVRRGMTREQLRCRGVTDRDIRYWTQNGYIEIREDA